MEVNFFWGGRGRVWVAGPRLFYLKGRERERDLPLVASPSKYCQHLRAEASRNQELELDLCLTCEWEGSKLLESCHLLGCTLAGTWYLKRVCDLRPDTPTYDVTSFVLRFILFERHTQKDRHIFCLLAHSLNRCNSLDWTSWEPEIWNSTQGPKYFVAVSGH